MIYYVIESGGKRVYKYAASFYNIDGGCIGIIWKKVPNNIDVKELLLQLQAAYLAGRGDEYEAHF